MISSNHGNEPGGRGSHRRDALRRTLEELGSDAETIQRAAALLDDAVGSLAFADEDQAESLGTSALQIQTASVALTLSLLGIVARTERLLAIVERRDDEYVNDPASKGSRSDPLGLGRRGRPAREPYMSTHRQSLRELIRASGNIDVLLELREFECAMDEMLHRLEMQSSLLRELHARVAGIAAEREAHRLEAVRTLEELSLRANTSGEQIVEALRQICNGLKAWGAEGNPA